MPKKPPSPKLTMQARLEHWSAWAQGSGACSSFRGEHWQRSRSSSADASRLPRRPLAEAEAEEAACFACFASRGKQRRLNWNGERAVMVVLEYRTRKALPRFHRCVEGA